MISHRHKCIFIHIPKCAGTSIERVLGHHDDYDDWGMQDHRTLAEIEPWSVSRRFSRRSLEATLSNLDRSLAFVPNRNPCNSFEVTRSQYLSYFRFTIVRNPWSRAYSWYRNVMNDERHLARLKIGTMSFADFIRRYAGEGLLRPQVEWLKNRSGAIDLDFIGRFENLEHDFSIVLNRLQLHDRTLPHLLSHGYSDSVTSVLDDETDDIIRRVYAEDIAAFNYARPPATPASPRTLGAAV